MPLLNAEIIRAVTVAAGIAGTNTGREESHDAANQEYTYGVCFCFCPSSNPCGDSVCLGIVAVDTVETFSSPERHGRDDP
jgi:hypothetical protein